MISKKLCCRSDVREAQRVQRRSVDVRSVKAKATRRVGCYGRQPLIKRGIEVCCKNSEMQCRARIMLTNRAERIRDIVRAHDDGNASRV